ncbi:hypothetical protein [Ilumatobacter sp.]|uniref:hypothetical protein n=1 Tax=Ilumatobacter sp. TaxID=1967498 RepID=UPI003B526A6E
MSTRRTEPGAGSRSHDTSPPSASRRTTQARSAHAAITTPAPTAAIHRVARVNSTAASTNIAP